MATVLKPVFPCSLSLSADVKTSKINGLDFLQMFVDNNCYSKTIKNCMSLTAKAPSWVVTLIFFSNLNIC